MSHWNYRVVRTTEPQTGKDLFAIHEVFYDDAGKMQARTADPVEAGGETLEELTHDLIRQLEACTNPVVEAGDIPEEGAEPLIPPGIESLHKYNNPDGAVAALRLAAGPETDEEL